MTIRMDDELYREVKATATRSGRSVSAVLRDAIRRGLHPPEQGSSGRYTVRHTGRGGLQPRVTLSSNAVLAEVMDADRSIDALRW